MDNEAAKMLTGDGMVVCQNSQGLEIRATLVRVTRHLVVFEVYNAQTVVRMSEVLSHFKIVINDRAVYSGRAVVSSLVNTGTMFVCEAGLEESWIDPDMFSLANGYDKLRSGYSDFIQQWEKLYKVIPQYKILIADMQTFLMDLRGWLDQVELSIRSSPSGDRLQLEREVVNEIAPAVVASLDALFEKFEAVAGLIAPDLQPAHHTYIKRQIHPLVLCSPFAYRTFHKPLGYAGDYEMVNMILRDPREGSSLFAKLLNVWFIKQPPAQAHRNRITYLTKKLTDETLRVKCEGRQARIYNLGCGPAWEIQNFMTARELCDEAQFVLLDFNDETLQHTTRTLNDLKTKYSRKTSIQLMKKSVVQVLKGGSKVTSGSSGSKYDLVYCAGLFDYLPDRICLELTNIFYEMVAPGGLLIVTNVDSSNPIRNMLDYLLEWHLIYRSGQQLLTLRPTNAKPEDTLVHADDTGVNIYMEVRKPRL